MPLARSPEGVRPAYHRLNRFNSWSRRGFWRAMLSALAEAGWVGEAAAIDSTYVKAHRPVRQTRPRRCLGRRTRRRHRLLVLIVSGP